MVCLRVHDIRFYSIVLYTCIKKIGSKYTWLVFCFLIPVLVKRHTRGVEIVRYS